MIDPSSVPPNATLRKLYTCCKRPTCGTCGGTEHAHGPYWYAQWREGKRRRNVYIGKTLPNELAVRRLRFKKKHGSVHDADVWDGLVSQVRDPLIARRPG